MYQVIPPSSGSVLKIKYHKSTQASEMSSCFSSTLPYLRARSTSPVGQWINPAGPQQRKSFNFENLATLPSLYNSTASSYRSLSTEPELIRQVRNLSEELSKTYFSQVQSWSSDSRHNNVSRNSRSSMPRLSIYHKSTIGK